MGERFDQIEDSVQNMFILLHFLNENVNILTK